MNANRRTFTHVLAQHPASTPGSLFVSRVFVANMGFTMAELLVAMSLNFILLGAIYSVYRVQTHSVKVQENRLEAHQYARAALDMMVREIRNAGYAPTGATCAVVVSASAQTLQFRYDANGDGDCGDSDEDITYSFSTAGCQAGFGNIMRNGSSLTDCNVPTGGANFSLVFYPKQTTTAVPAPYCFSAGDPSGCAGDLSASLGSIQRVAISLTIQSKNPDSEFGGSLQATVVSDAELRNHGLL